MKKIAFVTPWIPQYTGIADHIYNLVLSIRDSFEIDIITNATNPKPLKGVKIYHYQENIDYTIYNKIIYEIGNHYDFHGYMIPLIKKYRGVVHLHDLVLQSLMLTELTRDGKGWSEYLNTIEKWYGYNIRVLINELKVSYGLYFWDSDEVGLLPLFEEILQYSTSCIVHSDYAKSRVKSVFPQKRVDKLWLFPFLNKKFIESKRSNSHIFNIGVFGGVERHKQVDKIIKVVKKLSFDYNIKLHIVGEVNPNQKYLIENSKDIHFYGRVDECEFNNILRDTDICVNLRYPTMGETSSIAIRCLQQGIPLIVNNIGWYSELPSFVTKIEIENSIQELENSLVALLNRDEINSIKDKMREFLDSELNIENIKKSYIEEINGFNNNQDIYSGVFEVLGELKYI